MPKITPAAALLTLCLAAGGCSHEPMAEDLAAEWAGVLDAKRAWKDAGGDVEARQRYVETLRAFVDRHPGHARAREVYEKVELDFAERLASRGDYDGAIRYYRSVLETNPRNVAARDGLAEAERKRFVSAEAVRALEKGMSAEQVAQRLGRPFPGWSRRLVRGPHVTESWYYRRADGGLAAVFFRDGRLFAAELEGPVRLAR
ncbi:MAG: tetratricopeptide repeat protein [Thermoanaerobaculia bacterium]